ncbi:DNA translocase FtsK, partial [Bienertia sinuspersici]
MQPDLFLRLCKDLSSRYGLKPSCKMSVREKVGIFLFTLAQGVSNRTLSERFQRSVACRRVKGLAHDIIRPYDPDFKSIPAKIATDKKNMPYFK